MPLGVPRREISEVVRAWESNVKYGVRQHSQSGTIPRSMLHS